MQKSYIPSFKKIENLKRNLKKLFVLSNIVEGIYKEKYDLVIEELYPSTPRAFLKYIPLAWWSDVYTTIMGKRRKASKTKKFYYVDLLAGSGITYIEGTNKIIAGSPLIANYFNRHQYDGVFLTDKNPGRCRVLRRTMEIIKDIKWPNLKHSIPCRSAEELIMDIDNRFKIEEESHMFIFIDFEGPTDIEWDKLAILLKHPADAMINFQIKGVLRNRDRSSVLKKVYGDDFDVERGMDEDYYLHRYIERLKTTGREYVYPIRINDRLRSRIKRGKRGKYYYYLILAVRKTPRGSPWYKVWLSLRSWIEEFDAEITDLEREIFSGAQRTLDSY